MTSSQMSDMKVDRSLLLAGAIIVCVLNARALPIMQSLSLPGLLDPVLALFNVNAIVWLAFAAMISIAREGDNVAPLRRGDYGVLSVALLMALVPFATVSGVGVLLVSIWLFATSQAESPGRRISLIGIGLSCTLIIGRLLLILIGDNLLALDARLVAMLAGTQAEGNLVRFVDGTQFQIAATCSSLHNMSLAFLLWATATQTLKLPVTFRLVGFAALSLVGVILVNIFRLTLIAWYPSDFEVLHHGWGSEALGWLSLFVAATIVGWGAYDTARRPV
jgi:exosortase/archaeosortase family protein